MKKLAVSLAALATVAIAPAVAAQTVTIPINSGSATYGNGNLTCASGAVLPCTFSDTYTFATPTGYNLTSATISSTMVGDGMSAMSLASDVNFTSVTLNGINFNTVVTGYTEFRQLINQSIAAGGLNTLMVTGTTGGNGAYAGTLVFAASAVPEPAAWALMILGFGVVGYALRRRPSVRFAQA